MSDDVINQKIVDTAAALIEKSFIALLGKKDKISDYISGNLRTGFGNYLRSAVTELDRVKTLATGPNAVSLRRTYEPCEFRYDGENFSIRDLLGKFSNGENRALVTAMLGSGKSHTMKFIHNTIAIEYPQLGIPIFLELRNIEIRERAIELAILERIAPHNIISSIDGIEACLKAGAFFLLLDGFDEVNDDSKPIMQKEIINISKKYQSVKIVVSSRLDHTRFMSWHEFAEYNILPMDIEKLGRMIGKIQYDDGLKKLFMLKVKSELFSTHERFLSNPLLASMMLITFEEFQEIPSRMHVFYGVAFEVMFRKHDKTKFAYSRKMLTGLDLEAFRRVFMTFCLLSYLDEYHSFNNGSHINYISDAIQYESVEVDANDYADDIINKVNLLVLEGQKVEFIHRSFQEYFSAVFLTRKSIDDAFEYIDKIAATYSDSSEAVGMMIEMDKEEFERKYFLRKLKYLKSKIEDATDWREKLDLISPHFVIADMASSPSDEVTFENKKRSVPRYHFSPINIRRMVGGENANKPYIDPLLTKVMTYYNIMPYNASIFAKSNWFKDKPVTMKVEKYSHHIIGSSSFTKKFFVTLGFDKYINNLQTEIENTIEEIEIRHQNKKILLSRKITHQKTDDGLQN